MLDATLRCAAQAEYTVIRLLVVQTTKCLIDLNEYTSLVYEFGIIVPFGHLDVLQ